MKHLTLFIEAQANHNTWLPALEGLRIHLDTISHRELKVEFIDPRIDKSKKVLLIKWDPAFRHAWNDNIRHLVNNEILQNIRVGKMVDVGTGDEDDESPKTILITLFGEEAMLSGWRGLRGFRVFVQRPGMRMWRFRLDLGIAG